MQHLDPVSPEVSAQIDAYLQALKSSSSRDRTIYISGPMTTGRKYLDFVSAFPHADVTNDIKAACLRENILTLETHAFYQRQLNTGVTVINPGMTCIKGFTTNDYMTLWLSVLRECASTVIAIPDWEYSVGASIEVGVALNTRAINVIKPFTGKELTPPEARTQIFSAMEKYRHSSNPVIKKWFSDMTEVLRLRHHAILPFEWREDVLTKQS